MTTRTPLPLLTNLVPSLPQLGDHLWQLNLPGRVGLEITVHEQNEEAGRKQRIMFLPHPISKHSTDSSSLGRHSVINVCRQDRPYFTGEERGKGEMTSSDELSFLDRTKGEGRYLWQQEKQAFQILAKYTSLIMLWMTRASFQACRGKGWREKNALPMLFLSYLVRMAISPSDILVPPKCHIPGTAV